mmetsp:Transcript_1953/g.2416  ORF Transcript_1953/g.2416 Transcript_1953/m.2416 type:complete len:271 (-) Transcript_1953:94-906(-)|eukprot:CAMPEP_0172508658 /NCGR_PEP_ID=MMETSP1066-20121228/213645_1 /TAXON_ID=671091 /ORGANISM="Coscinodiscus wailesii, Strain CCMP2513" /LENGTH=270 /DNA_ID=CAMNT_0013286727 /DNA_START=38 /DNA_END=850 /DNA_ORIENTATION=-
MTIKDNFDITSNRSHLHQEIKHLLGKSWYDGEAEHRNITGRITCSRILFVALIIDLERDEKRSQINDPSFLAQFLHKEISVHTPTSDPEEVTGGIILLSSPRNIGEKKPVALLGFLEASPRNVNDVITTFSKSPMLHSLRVITSSEDCPVREFSNFGLYLATPDEEEEVEIDENGTEVAFDILERLCRYESQFAEKDGAMLSPTIKFLEGENRTAVPSTARVVACAVSDFFPTAIEYLELFDSPIYSELESNCVFPLLPVVDYDDVLPCS